MQQFHLNGQSWLPLIEKLSLAKNWHEIAQVLAEQLEGVLPYDMIACSLVHHEEGYAELVIPVDKVRGQPRYGERLNLEGTATGWVVQHKRPLLETEGQEFTSTFANIKEQGFHSRLAIPIEVGGEVIAALVFHKREPNAYSEDDISCIQPILPIIATFILQMREQMELEQALERERKARQELEILRRFHTLLLSGEAVDKVLQLLAELLLPFVPFDRFSMSVYDEPTNREWLYVFWHNGPVWEVIRVRPFIRYGAAKELMRTGKPMLRHRLDPEKYPSEKWLVEQGFRSALVYPLKMRGRFKATFNFSSYQPERFNDNHIAFLDRLAEHISIAIDSLLQEREAEEYAKMEEGLLQLSMDLLSARSVEEVFSAAKDMVSMIGIDYISLLVRFPNGELKEMAVQPEGVQLKDVEWLPQPLKKGQTILGDILLGERDFFVSNDPVNEVSEIERQVWFHALGEEIYQFGNAVVPIKGHTGTLGAICVDFRNTRRFLSPQDKLVKLLQTIANLLGVTIENLWLDEEIQHQLRETQLLYQLTFEAASGKDLEQIAQLLVETLPTILPCYSASVLLLSEDKKHLDFAATYPKPPPEFPKGFRFPISMGIVGYVARTGEPVLERDVRTNPYCVSGHAETLSELCVPIKVGKEVIGVINIESPKLAAFNERHLSFMQSLAAQLGTVIERAQLLHRQSELVQQLSAIFDSVHEGITLILPDGKLSDVNRRFGDLVGVPAENLRNQPVSLLVDALIQRAVDLDEMKEALDASLSDLTQPVFDTLILTSPECVLERYCIPVRLPDGTLIGQLWVLRDVTEERRKQQEILRLERLKTLGELTGGIAHDLNNALSPVLTGSELLRQITEGEAQVIAETIYHSIQRVHDIIQRLQGFYKMTAASIQTTVDVHHLLQSAISATRHYWQDFALGKGVIIQVETRFCGEPAMTKGIPSELQQVFVNLINNAVEAIIEKAKITGEKKGLICITTHCTPKHISIQVFDDGIGMSEETQRRAFEAFFTTKGDMGVGLGLSNALAIVVVHGGNISLRSQPMEGTTVTVTLPSVQPTEVGIPAPPAKAEFPRWKVLVVDDHYLTLQTLLVQLQKLGLEVVTANHGGEAWEILQKEEFDLVVADLSMPVMNGLELTKQIRQKFPNLPVIILTDWGDVVPHRELQSLKVFDVLSKPISLQVWRETLTSLMERMKGMR